MKPEISKREKKYAYKSRIKSCSKIGSRKNVVFKEVSIERIYLHCFNYTTQKCVCLFKSSNANIVKSFSLHEMYIFPFK